jgi:hypothetical protein
MVLQLAIIVGRAGQAIERVVGDVELHHALPQLGQFLVWVWTFMPSSTGVVQEAGRAARAVDLDEAEAAGAEGFELSVAQSLGILVPISSAARHHEVPAGTVTLSPSMLSVTSWVARRIGVPKSAWG